MVCNFKDIAEWSGDDGYYEWDEIHVYRRDDGALSVDRQSGCSCNCYEVDYAEHKWRHDAASFYKDIDDALEHGCYFTAAQAVEIKSAVRNIWKDRNNAPEATEEG